MLLLLNSRLHSGDVDVTYVVVGDYYRDLLRTPLLPDNSLEYGVR